MNFVMSLGLKVKPKYLLLKEQKIPSDYKIIDNYLDIVENM